MSSKYHTKTPLTISALGIDVELDLVVTYSVSRYRAATLTQPEEPRSVEVENIRFTRCGLDTSLPGWLEDAICESEGFKAHLLDEANDKDICAAEDAAEARRDREWEDRL